MMQSARWALCLYAPIDAPTWAPKSSLFDDETMMQSAHWAL